MMVRMTRTLGLVLAGGGARVMAHSGAETRGEGEGRKVHPSPPSPRPNPT